jgi:signal transduction histidine kinase
VLAEFSGVMAGTRSNEVVLEEMARVVGEGSGARDVQVWLRLGRDLRPAAGWPSDEAGSPPGTVALVDDGLPELPAEVAVPVLHDGELLGALTVRMPPSEPATAATRTLVADLAAQAGLVLRNVQLIEELRASRRRLVTAQDEERRRLERNLHDGAQQQLIGLRLRLRLAESLLPEDLADDEPVRQALADLGEAAQSALDDLRDLARGIYPPLLAERGLRAALEGQARKSAIDVRVWTGELGRYPQEAEAAVYFCSLEALQNVAKYAGAGRATLRLWQDARTLAFTVSDEGAGFDPGQVGYGTGLQGMADRLAALGGTLTVTSRPGAGTTVTGRVPVT